MYGQNTGYHCLIPTAGTSNVSNYLPASTGYLATTGSTSAAVGGTAKPIYVTAGGVLTALSATAGGTTQPVYLNAGTLSAITSVAVAYGGTGATTAAAARTNLGIAVTQLYSGTLTTGSTTFNYGSYNFYIVVGQPSSGSSRAAIVIPKAIITTSAVSYQFADEMNYYSFKPYFVYSWRLEPTDPQPVGKKPCLSLRELEKQIGYDLDSKLDPLGKNITVEELINRYLSTKTGIKPNTLMNYNFVRNLMKNEPFSRKKIGQVKVSDAKLFLIKLQQDGKGYSTVKTVRGVLRPAFQMAVDDDLILKNPFGFQLAGVVVNDSVTREAIKPDQMRKFLKFIHDDNVYCKYYEVVFILFHTGMRISEFCGLTIRDLDMENRIINIDHQLQRTGMTIHIESAKTNAGTRKIPMTEEVFRCFQGILEDREPPTVEKIVDGYSGFLFLDREGLPEVAMHWEHRFNHMVHRYNEIYRVQIPNITPHVCRHTYCSNMARAGMNPKTLQYLMGHSDIGVTMNTYTHLGLEDAQNEMVRLEELNRAKEEVAKAAGEKKPVTQRSFRAV